MARTMLLGNTFPEYVFIRASILTLRLIAPMSMLYLAASACTRSLLFSPALAVLAIAETLFYVFVYVPRTRKLQKPPTYKPVPLTKPEREALFRNCYITRPSSYRGLPFPKGWFLPRRVGDNLKIRRQDVIEWLLCIFFPGEDFREDWREELDTYVELVQRLLGESYDDKPGVSDVKGIRLTVDPVRTLHRPLIFYSMVCVVDTISSLELLYLGFKHYSSTNKWFQTFPLRPVLSLVSGRANLTPDILLPYWYRPHKSSSKLPIVFLHGIGIGLHFYVPFIRDIIARDPDIGILLVEFLPISMHMTSQSMPPIPKLASALNNILDTLNIPRIVVAAHSYGTFILTGILRDACTGTSTYASGFNIKVSPGLRPRTLSSRIAHIMLIDPIPILMHLPSTAYNLLHRPPSTAAEWQIWYFLGTDPDVARTFGRTLFWTEGVTWAEGIQNWMRVPAADAQTAWDDGRGPSVEVRQKTRGRNVAVVLAGKDLIIPAESILEYVGGLPEASVRVLGQRRADRKQTSGGIDTRGVSNGNDIFDRLTVNGEQGNCPSDDAKVRKREEGDGKLEVLYYPELNHTAVFDTRNRREAMLETLRRFVRDK